MELEEEICRYSLAELRRDLSIAQEDLAAALDVNQPAVSKLERAAGMSLSRLRDAVEALVRRRTRSRRPHRRCALPASASRTRVCLTCRGRSKKSWTIKKSSPTSLRTSTRSTAMSARSRSIWRVVDRGSVERTPQRRTFRRATPSAARKGRSSAGRGLYFGVPMIALVLISVSTISGSPAV